MADTFRCDNCGREFPVEQLKEAFRDEGDRVVREELCPECLDQKMNEAGDVYGVDGQEKRRAVFLASQEGARPDQPVTGRRE